MNHTFVVLAFKESEYLEKCIKSVLNQKLKTNVVIATSTPNDYINKLAKKYKLEVKVNKDGGSISKDFNFALTCANTELITIAHQDDLYDEDYAYEVVNAYNKHRDLIILFTDYYEIKNNKKIITNTNLKIKRVLLLPLKIKFFSNLKMNKRAVIRYGNAVCCPSVTFVKDKIPKDIFVCNFKCNLDWNAWERLSRLKGKFIYVGKKLMGHRVHEGSTTTEIIKDNIRTKEDYEMYKRFWPSFIAKALCKVYRNSEKGNEVK